LRRQIPFDQAAGFGINDFRPFAACAAARAAQRASASWFVRAKWKRRAVI
jgi:hypothetical protein